MMEPSKTIWVFRTSVSSRMDINRLKPILERLVETNDKWNFDLEDCDHILRVETRSIAASTIIAELKNVGYQCEELEDINLLPNQVIHSFEFDLTLREKSICGY